MGILSFLFDACMSQLLKGVSQKIFLLCWVERNCEMIFWQFCLSHVQCVAFRFTSITPTAAKLFRLRTIDECFNVKNRWRNTAVDCWFFEMPHLFMHSKKNRRNVNGFGVPWFCSPHSQFSTAVLKSECNEYLSLGRQNWDCEVLSNC